MIARVWHGKAPIQRSREYLKLLRTVGLGEYKEIPGNRAAFVLQRIEGGVVHVILLSFWESLDSIKAYAGDDIEVPRYTTFDPNYLIELEPTVQHHTVLNRDSPPSDGVSVIARMWHGAVPLDKSDAYAGLMRTVALVDYESTPGNRGAFVLHRIEGDVAHFLMLTLWESRAAIGAFAGDNIELARYYDFDREYLIEMEPTVLHFEVFGSE